MNKNKKCFKITYKKLVTYEFLAEIDKNHPKNEYELNFIDGEDLNIDWMGWGVKSLTPKKEVNYKSISVDYEIIKKGVK
tara:strand:+ start:1967 stop:2203 length:237 start_codon:yes stop_codon:yes gene_type:complete